MNTNVIVCPKCQTRCQIPAGVPQFTCPGCGALCRGPARTTKANPETAPSGNKSAAKKSAGEKKTASDADKEPADRSNLFAIAALGAAALMILFLVVAVVSLRMSRPDQETREANAAAAEALADQQRRDAIVYRQVDLPESERKRLYRDLSSTKQTTIDAKLPLTKESQTRKFIQGNLQKVLDREIEMQSIMNKVSPEDLAEILKEGEAKNWQ